jgi:two-component system NtrC family sensor kinase
MVSENRLMLDKLAAIGLLAGGVAHELNNPLGQILLLAGMMAQDAPAGSQLAQDLAQVETATLRAKTIVSELLDFARTRTAELGPVSLAVIAAKSITLSKFRLIDIDVRVEQEGAGRKVFGDASRLQQVVLNLLSNAVDAIAQSRREGKESGHIVVKTWDDGTDCHLSIHDDGAGIPAEAQAKIFDSFYSTKAAGPGTGLGLPVSLGIVRDHGGRLEVRSSPGEGSTFVLSVPSEAAAAAAA